MSLSELDDLLNDLSQGIEPAQLAEPLLSGTHNPKDYVKTELGSRLLISNKELEDIDNIILSLDNPGITNPLSNTNSRQCSPNPPCAISSSSTNKNSLYFNVACDSSSHNNNRVTSTSSHNPGAPSSRPQTVTHSASSRVVSPPDVIRGTSLYNPGNLNAPSSYSSNGFTPAVPDSSSPICSGCRQVIYSQLIQAGSLLFHPECFTCSLCSSPIGVSKFHRKPSDPQSILCTTCYGFSTLPRCAHCSNPITVSCINAINKSWHVNCFICAQCLRPFGTSMFYEKDSNAFCEGCYNGIFSDRCGGCGQPIKGEKISACGKKWHVNHLMCNQCRTVFGKGGMLWEDKGSVYCEPCFRGKQGLICGCGCGILIGERQRVVQAVGKNWIESHFACGFCMNPLKDLKFKEKDRKGYCEICYLKLFTGFTELSIIN